MTNFIYLSKQLVTSFPRAILKNVNTTYIAGVALGLIKKRKETIDIQFIAIAKS